MVPSPPCPRTTAALTSYGMMALCTKGAARAGLQWALLKTRLVPMLLTSVDSDASTPGCQPSFLVRSRTGCPTGGLKPCYLHRFPPRPISLPAQPFPASNLFFTDVECSKYLTDNLPNNLIFLPYSSSAIHNPTIVHATPQSGAPSHSFFGFTEE